ncbi:hypothetical protein [Streptomyces sp. NPDC002845]
MNSVRWELRDTFSGAFGHRQLVADSGRYVQILRAHGAWIDHASACERCWLGDERCSPGALLWEAYQTVRFPEPL